MIVRAARAEELAEVGELRVAAYTSQHLLDRVPWYADRLRRLGEHGEVLVAVDGGKILGTVLLERWHEGSELAAGPADAEIRAFAVAPDAQGRGVGRMLVRAVVERAAAQGATRVLLSTQPIMFAAQRLYEEAGFVRAPELDFEPAQGFTMLAYQKILHPAASDRPKV